MSEYSFKELWDRDKLDEYDRREKQTVKAEADLLEGMTVAEGLASGFWKIIKEQFIRPKLSGNLIDTCADSELLSVRQQRRVLVELIKFLDAKTEAGKQANRFLKTIKEGSG